MTEKKNIMDYETVELDDQENALVIIDQTKLPGKTEILRLKTAQEMWDAPRLSEWPLLSGSTFLPSRFRPRILIRFTANSESRRNIWIPPV